MHIVIHEYEDGSRFIFETDELGRNVREVEGERKVGKRIRAVLDMLCDNNDDGAKTLLSAIEHGREIIEKRNAGEGASA